MRFADDLHREKFQELMCNGHKHTAGKDYLAAAFLLSAPLLWKKSAPYIRPGGIHFSGLLEECGAWSSGEQGLLRLAASLFNCGWKADLNDVFWNLDAKNLDLALEALRIRFQG